MHYSIVFSIALLAPVVTARNCNKGLQYCGATLLSIGAYSGQVTQALKDANQPTDDDTANNSLFDCLGGSNGDIKFVSHCTVKCVDGGAGKSDYCAQGRDCTKGLDYCGRTLLDINNYADRLNAALKDAGQPADDSHRQTSLFSCGDGGNVKFDSACIAGCHDGGPGQSDSCNDAGGRCTKGLEYCGSSLLQKGRYRDQIGGALRAAGQPDVEFQATNGLFVCLGGTDGDVQFKSLCLNGCADNGAGKSDTCDAESCVSDKKEL